MLFGNELAHDARLCRAVLADICCDTFPAERQDLIAAVKKGVVAELADATGRAIDPGTVRDWGRRLAENGALDDRRAGWVLNCWAGVFNVKLPPAPPASGTAGTSSDRPSTPKIPIPSPISRTKPPIHPVPQKTNGRRWRSLLVLAVVFIGFAAVIARVFITTLADDRPLDHNPPMQLALPPSQQLQQPDPAPPNHELGVQQSSPTRFTAPALPVPEHPAPLATATLCGRSVVYDASDMIGGDGFAGVWSGGNWNNRVCGALVVEALHADGSATVLYVYATKSDGLAHV